MRIIQEVIFLEPKVQEGSWEASVFVDAVKSYIQRLKTVRIRSHGLEIQLVMNERPYILGNPGSGRKELEKAVADYKRGVIYKDGKPPKKEEREPERLPTRAEIEHQRWLSQRQKQRIKNAKNEDEEFE